MVKQRKKNSRENPVSKGFKKNRAKARKINASTGFDTCTEQLNQKHGRKMAVGGRILLLRKTSKKKFARYEQ